MGLILEEERWVRGPDGAPHERRLVVDHDLPLQVDGLMTKVPQRPETDAEVLARVDRAAKDEAERVAFAASEEGKQKAALDARRRELLAPFAGFERLSSGAAVRMDPVLDAVSIFLADAFLDPADLAEERLKEARRPAKEAREAAASVRKALPLTPTAGMQPDASLAEIQAAQAEHREALARIDALDAQAVLLEQAIDPQLEIRARRLRDLADKAAEDRRRGQLKVPLPASARFVWSDEDSCLLAHLLHVHTDPASAIYGALHCSSGTPTPSLRSLWALARLSTAGRSFDDDSCVPEERRKSEWLVEDHNFQCRMSHVLRGSLYIRLRLSPEEGRKIQKRDGSWGPKPELVGVASGRQA